MSHCRKILLMITFSFMFCSCADRGSKTAQKYEEAKPESQSRSVQSTNQIRSLALVRRLDDIKFTDQLTESELFAIWGQPDGTRGSGLPYWEYTLPDGREVWVTFFETPPYRLNVALVGLPGSGKVEQLFPRANK